MDDVVGRRALGLLKIAVVGAFVAQQAG